MKYVCDAPTGTWFRLETHAEALRESTEMSHAVERYFHMAEAEAMSAWQPSTEIRYIEQSIGRKDFVQRTMPRFLTLRDGEGNALATAMLPAEGADLKSLRPIIVGPGNADPYENHAASIEVLAKHYGMRLERERCYPYGRE